MLQAPEPPLTDGVVLLRPFVEADLETIVAVVQDPEIPRWTRVPSPYGEADGRAFLEEAATSWENGTAATFAVVDPSTRAFLASIGIHEVGPVAEVGYFVAREARGRGVATRALELVSRWALRELRVERLELLADPENVASQRVAEKAGFTREGLLRSYLEIKGRLRDCVMFSLVPSDLERSVPDRRIDRRGGIA